MRKMTAILVSVIFLFSVAGSKALAQSPEFVFGIKPGAVVQSSYFGLAKNRLQPFVGLDMLGLSVNMEDKEGSAMIFVPHLGTKWYLTPDRSANKVAPYFQGTFFFSFASVNIDELSSGEEELVKDALEFWGLSGAFGAEYFFSNKFSLGGEYGLRYLRDEVEEHRDEPQYPGDPGRKVNDKLTVKFNVTYAAVSLNYHF